MKKLITFTFLVVTIIFSGLYFSINSKAETNTSTNLKEKIEEFSNYEKEKQVKVEKILMEKGFGNDYSVVLFNNNEGIGYAILENNNIVLVTFGNNLQAYDQFKNFYIVYGEKPKADYQELKITIETGINHENLEEAIALDSEKYYLHVNELPKGITGTKVYSENYIFN